MQSVPTGTIQRRAIAEAFSRSPVRNIDPNASLGSGLDLSASRFHVLWS